MKALEDRGTLKRKMYQDMVSNKGKAPKDKPLQIQDFSRKKEDTTATASFGD